MVDPSSPAEGFGRPNKTRIQSLGQWMVSMHALAFFFPFLLPSSTCDFYYSCGGGSRALLSLFLKKSSKCFSLYKYVQRWEKKALFCKQIAAILSLFVLFHCWY